MAYREEFRGYEREARWTISRVVGLVIVLMVAGLGVRLVGGALGWFGEAASVAQEEFGPRALLDKYEWFKDASAALDKKRADVGVYDARLRALQESYGAATRSEWAREDREQVNVWMSEVAGIKASYNSLAAEYNAQMVKFNWRFANAGELPQGAEMPLPREYKPYTTE